MAAERNKTFIHELFVECLSSWYDNLPKGRRSFILRILEITGEAGVEAVRLNDDNLICIASMEGRGDVVRTCIEYGANVHAQGITHT